MNNSGIIFDIAIFAAGIWTWSFVWTARRERKHKQRPYDWRKDGM